MALETKKKKSKRIFYFDALRALAIVCVVIVHTVTMYKSMIFHAWLGPTLSWIASDFMHNPMRIGVLLFLMLSGALSLGRDWEIKPFLSKRIPRIVYPFFFWNIIFILLFIVLSNFQLMHIVKAFDYNYLVDFIIKAFTGDVYGFNPNWFFWMILGTYLIMPIFNKWLLHADLKEAEYFLVFWLITAIFNFTLETKFPIKLTYFVSPIGLVVCGYYLRHTERKFLNNPYYALLAFIISSAASMYFAYLRSSPTDLYFFDRYSIFNTVNAISVFIIFKNFSKFNIKVHFKRLEEGFRKLVAALAKYSYGMYLVHYPLMLMLYNALPRDQLPYGVLVAATFLFGVFASLALLAVLNRVPNLNDIIGAK